MWCAPRPHRRRLRPARAEPAAGRGMLARLDDLTVEEIFASGLHEFIEEFIAENTPARGGDRRAVTWVNSRRLGRRRRFRPAAERCIAPPRTAPAFIVTASFATPCASASSTRRSTVRQSRPELIQMLRLTPGTTTGSTSGPGASSRRWVGRLSRRSRTASATSSRLQRRRAEEGLAIRVVGEVETTEDPGVMRGTAEWLPDRSTCANRVSPSPTRRSGLCRGRGGRGRRTVSTSCTGSSRRPPDRRLRPGPDRDRHQAAEAFALRKGVGQDLPTSSSRRRATRDPGALRLGLLLAARRPREGGGHAGSRPGCRISVGSGRSRHGIAVTDAICGCDRARLPRRRAGTGQPHRRRDETMTVRSASTMPVRRRRPSRARTRRRARSRPRGRPSRPPSSSNRRRSADPPLWHRAIAARHLTPGKRIRLDSVHPPGQGGAARGADRPPDESRGAVSDDLLRRDLVEGVSS